MKLKEVDEDAFASSSEESDAAEEVAALFGA
jgi:hypothetical protein